MSWRILPIGFLLPLLAAGASPLPKHAVSRLGSDVFRSNGLFSQLTFHEDHLFSLGNDGTFQAWRLRPKKELDPAFTREGIRWFGLSGDGETLAFLQESVSTKGFREVRKTRLVVTKSNGGSSFFLPKRPKTAALRPDGSVVIIAGQNILEFRRTSDGEVIRTLKAPNVTVLAVSKDGKFVAAGDEDNGVSVWNISTGERLFNANEHRKPVLAMAFSPDNNILATGADDDQIILWDIRNRTKKRFSLAPDQQMPLSIGFSPDGVILGAVGGDGVASLWEMKSKKVWRIRFSSYGLTALAFSPDGKTMACGGKSVHLFDLASKKELIQDFGHEETVTCLALSPHKDYLISGSRDETICIWDLRKGVGISRTQAHKGGVLCLAFFPNSKGFASAGWDNEIKIWDFPDANLQKILRGHQGPVWSIDASVDGKLLASGSGDKTVRVWNVQSGQEIKSFHHDRRVDSVRFSPDGETLAFSSGGPWADETINLWNWKKGNEPRVLSKPGSCLDFTRDGRILVAGGRSGITVWEVLTGKMINELWNDAKITAVCVCSDARTFLSCDTNGWIKVWDFTSTKPLGKLTGKSGAVRAISSDSNGAVVAAGNDNSTILIWDIRPLLASHPPYADIKKTPEDCWFALGEKDARKGLESVLCLWKQPKECTEFLGTHLSPVATKSKKELARLVDELCSKDLSIRQKAAKELLNCGEMADKEMKKKMASELPLEDRRRIEAALRRSESNQLRCRRAIQALEYVGSPEAWEVIHRMSQGSAQSEITREAAATLKRRLKQR
ncbi:MAG TPA: WD40 repeat domain-containing protein [Gemmataceae bacterium]|nr:WD40 repeat domain-containing protein [Gemmataceae bacterium]